MPYYKKMQQMKLLPDLRESLRQNFTSPGFEGENVEIGQLSFSKKVVQEFEA